MKITLLSPVVSTVLNISTDEIYNIIPRCIVAPGSIDLAPDQLSSPYTQGTLQFEYDDMLYSLSGEFRRMPIKLSCEIKYLRKELT